MKRLQAEMSKKKPKSHLCSLMEKTFAIRQRWIQKEEPSVADILEMFPSFKHPKVVSFMFYLWSQYLSHLVVLSDVFRHLLKSLIIVHCEQIVFFS